MLNKKLTIMFKIKELNFLLIC